MKPLFSPYFLRGLTAVEYAAVMDRAGHIPRGYIHGHWWKDKGPYQVLVSTPGGYLDRRLQGPKAYDVVCIALGLLEEVQGKVPA